ncbi:methyltransferase domain-containing protein [Thiocapsa rosea]|uniref:Methyltransferase family protein n=1 Tax=Thiocapsa rosea TaxID=69360 RepID=A0A495VDK2_9GAMM|nr:methyltransferase domain-containing protein [Thiocapsa rosea]RKT47442.1 methyltransferase family protein [Thiocapsa rosea]
MRMKHMFFYLAGIGFLALAKAKFLLKGYSSPKPFDFSESDRCIDYDIQIVEQWLTYLEGYTQGAYSLAGKNVLELGPGSDLGIGIYLLAKGCSQYNACDVNNLMSSTPNEFYEKLFLRLEAMNASADIAFLREQLNNANTEGHSRLNYVVRDDFDIASAFGESTVDLVFSHAAFEHFDDVKTTISILSTVCKPSAILVAEIDLKTHSRWIRKKDPNNIYRYPQWIYDRFRFRGIPNRLRPFQYKEIFEKLGWTNLTITPVGNLHNTEDCYSGMSKMFSDKKNQMEYLSIMVCATRAG